MKNVGFIIKKHLLTGISYMIPLIVASGICIALAQIFGGINVAENEGTLPYFLSQIGGWGMSLVVPLIAGAIAMSISDRPGLAPGLIIGFIANEIGTGFIGGIIGGFLVGYAVIFIKKYIRLPKSMEGLMPIMIIPVLATVICGLLMITLIGQPIAAFQNTTLNWLQSMEGGSNFILGSILGAMASFDFGGPVNKTMSLFADGLLVDGVYGPQAVKFIGSMVPPFGIALSFLFTRYKYTKMERETLKAAVPMGICMITEGVIPIAARDIIRVVASCSLGAAVGGGLSMSLGVGSTVPHGGLLVVPLMIHPLYFLMCLGIGSLVTGVTLSLWKPAIKAEEENMVEEEENDMEPELIDIEFKRGAQ
ncbi:PTS system unknown substrate IIC component (Fru family) [Sinobaca qinghaiensis]|uniref:PTS EIIC type-2 domain-containing protein n=1 Tax=Sinobaca qinghaiensis TaxID=342944 RepID=A0A419V4P1_9BACL|nr:PTS fructose transporter subunit IIC [Sinobaca qinghaiensis]RKD73356.1 PTS system unknown substrate IIC component (Fru family) [Sinobaca qinghaiensis]